MTAVTRWVEYPIDGAGSASVTSYDTNTGVGQRGFSPADGATDKDKFNIGAGNNLSLIHI